jgi:hypothetical protein
MLFNNSRFSNFEFVCQINQLAITKILSLREEKKAFLELSNRGLQTKKYAFFLKG